MRRAMVELQHFMTMQQECYSTLYIYISPSDYFTYFQSIQFFCIYLEPHTYSTAFWLPSSIIRIYSIDGESG